VKDIVLVDATPHTFGIEMVGAVATPLIARNTPAPVKKMEISGKRAEAACGLIHVDTQRFDTARHNEYLVGI
jgi:molecular chaperone DnaK